MGAKRLFTGFLVFGGFSSLAVIYFFPELCVDLEPPELTDEYFGRGIVPSDPDEFPEDDPEIRKFHVKIQDSVLEDLKQRLNNTRFVEPLDNVQFQYGFHASYLKEVIAYWKDKFDWRAQESKLNKFDHYVTQIEGIDIHFIHQKPDIKNKKIRVFPLLMIHGWPGSIVEFMKILPLLTTARKDRDYVFEVICPSIPGYGFSEAPHQPGFNIASAARIFSKLMDRLGFAYFYVQGGHWGASIATTMAIAYPNRVLGSHVTIGPSILNKVGVVGSIKYTIGHLYYYLFKDVQQDTKMYPLTNLAYFLLEEYGYFHIQATKPDTIAASLSDSPAGLAAYILEKFSTWTDSSFLELEDGGLTWKFSLDELLTNVMIYWSTNSIASSLRFYKENAAVKFQSLNFEKMPVKVPVGIAAFPNEILHFPKFFIGSTIRNIVRYTEMPRGGHFAAMEEPFLLSDDVWDFVIDVEKTKVLEK